MPNASKRLYEWTGTAIMAGIGVSLILPGQTMQGPIFEPLASIAGEHTWASVFIAVAILRAAALWINGNSPAGSPAIRALAAAFGVIVFLVLSVKFASVAPIGWWAASVYAVLAGAELAVIYRAVQELTYAVHRYPT